MNEPASITWPTALERISARANTIDTLNQWPTESIADLTAAGAMTWSIPLEFGGSSMSPVELHARYEQLSGACLTTALIFTQRDAAVSFLAANPTPLAQQLLHEMAANQTFITIGISQLTTSRKNAVTATSTPEGFTLNGAVPWVTSLHHNHRVIVGAVLPDHQQILIALNVNSPGIQLPPALQLAALTASDTGELLLQNTLVPTHDILRPPSPDALAGRERAFPLTTCILPLGLAHAAITQAQSLAKTSPAQSAIAHLQSQHQSLRNQIYTTANADPQTLNSLAPNLRAHANSLANRSALAALELAKGHGLLLTHPAQRRAREALFFFVWSSPTPIIEANLAALTHQNP